MMRVVCRVLLMLRHGTTNVITTGSYANAACCCATSACSLQNLIKLDALHEGIPSILAIKWKGDALAVGKPQGHRSDAGPIRGMRLRLMGFWPIASIRVLKRRSSTNQGRGCATAQGGVRCGKMRLVV